MSDRLPEWRVEPGLLPYPQAIAFMEARVDAIRAGKASELIWLVEHPPIYTAGTSAVPTELLAHDRFPVFQTGRGGRHTYHGPGQRVVYVMLNLDSRGRDIRRFIEALEAWIIAALFDQDVVAKIIAGKVGVWVDGPSGPAKIAAIGVRVRRWITFHGFSINVSPDLSHFGGIIPCGLSEPVISLAAMGKSAEISRLDMALQARLRALLVALTPIAHA